MLFRWSPVASCVLRPAYRCLLRPVPLPVTHSGCTGTISPASSPPLAFPCCAALPVSARTIAAIFSSLTQLLAFGFSSYPHFVPIALFFLCPAPFHSCSSHESLFIFPPFASLAETDTHFITQPFFASRNRPVPFFSRLFPRNPCSFAILIFSFPRESCCDWPKKQSEPHNQLPSPLPSFSLRIFLDLSLGDAVYLEVDQADAIRTNVHIDEKSSSFLYSALYLGGDPCGSFPFAEAILLDFLGCPILSLPFPLFRLHALSSQQHPFDPYARPLAVNFQCQFGHPFRQICAFWQCLALSACVVVRHSDQQWTDLCVVLACDADF